MPQNSEEGKVTARQGNRLTSATLTNALRADGGSNRELSERAGISFRAMAEARNGFDPDELRGTRKRRGVASSMTRLAICLGVDPADVLRDLNIDPTDVRIRKQIKTARDASALRGDKDDRVMSAVRARMNSSTPGPIVGIVPWKPFSGGGASVARLLARSVLGSLNPEWNREVNLREESNFVAAQERLLSNDPDRPDVLLGLYDLPWRRQGFVDVVPLPGLRVAIGGLCTRPITWPDLLAGAGDLPHALVIEGDIGDRILRGPADYPEVRLIASLKTFDPDEIARRIRRELDQLSAPGGFLFVADGPLVRSVYDSLSVDDLPDDRKPKMVDPRWAPTVRFGFAITHDSERFKGLLEAAITEDLFSRVLPRTVNLYLDLLKSDNTKQLRLDLADIESEVPGAAQRFVDLALEFGRDSESLLNKTALDGKDSIECYIAPAKTRREEPRP